MERQSCRPGSDVEYRLPRGALELGHNGLCSIATAEVTLDSVASGAVPASERSWIGLQHAGRVIRFVETRYAAGDSERRARAAFQATRVDVFAMTLREMFVAIARDRREARRE